jgi:ribonuclease HI
MKYTIHTDGGSRGNPGPASIGVVIEGDAIGKKEYSEYIGIATNNEAEYKAIVFAMKKVKLLISSDKAAKADLDFYLDSELLVKQLNHEYKVKDNGIQKLFLEVHNLRLDFGKISFHHVPRERNKSADRLVNEALDRESNKLDL